MKKSISHLYTYIILTICMYGPTAIGMEHIESRIPHSEKMISSLTHEELIERHEATLREKMNLQNQADIYYNKPLLERGIFNKPTEVTTHDGLTEQSKFLREQAEEQGITLPSEKTIHELMKQSPQELEQNHKAALETKADLQDSYNTKKSRDDKELSWYQSYKKDTQQAKQDLIEHESKLSGIRIAKALQKTLQSKENINPEGKTPKYKPKDDDLDILEKSNKEQTIINPDTIENDLPAPIRAEEQAITLDDDEEQGVPLPEATKENDETNQATINEELQETLNKQLKRDADHERRKQELTETDEQRTARQKREVIELRLQEEEKQQAEKELQANKIREEKQRLLAEQEAARKKEELQTKLEDAEKEANTITTNPQNLEDFASTLGSTDAMSDDFHKTVVPEFSDPTEIVEQLHNQDIDQHIQAIKKQSRSPINPDEIDDDLSTDDSDIDKIMQQQATRKEQAAKNIQRNWKFSKDREKFKKDVNDSRRAEQEKFLTERQQLLEKLAQFPDTSQNPPQTYNAEDLKKMNPQKLEKILQEHKDYGQHLQRKLIEQQILELQQKEARTSIFSKVTGAVGDALSIPESQDIKKDIAINNLQTQTIEKTLEEAEQREQLAQDSFELHKKKSQDLLKESDHELTKQMEQLRQETQQKIQVKHTEQRKKLAQDALESHENQSQELRNESDNDITQHMKELQQAQFENEQKNIQNEVESFKEELEQQQQKEFEKLLQDMKNERDSLQRQNIEQEEQQLREKLSENQQTEFDKLMQQMQEAQKKVLQQERQQLLEQHQQEQQAILEQEQQEFERLMKQATESLSEAKQNEFARKAQDLFKEQEESLSSIFNEQEKELNSLKEKSQRSIDQAQKDELNRKTQDLLQEQQAEYKQISQQQEDEFKRLLDDATQNLSIAKQKEFDRKAQELFDKQNKAATKIQSIQRKRIAQKELAQRQQQAKKRKAERIEAYNKEQQEADITHMSDIYEQTTRPTQQERQASYEQRKQQAKEQKIIDDVNKQTEIVKSQTPKPYPIQDLETMTPDQIEAIKQAYEAYGKQLQDLYTKQVAAEQLEQSKRTGLWKLAGVFSDAVSEKASEVTERAINLNKKLITSAQETKLLKQETSFREALDQQQQKDFEKLLQQMKHETQNTIQRQNFEQKEQQLREELSKNQQTEFDDLMKQMQEAQKQIQHNEQQQLLEQHQQEQQANLEQEQQEFKDFMKQATQSLSQAQQIEFNRKTQDLFKEQEDNLSSIFNEQQQELESIRERAKQSASQAQQNEFNRKTQELLEQQQTEYDQTLKEQEDEFKQLLDDATQDLSVAKQNELDRKAQELFDKQNKAATKIQSIQRKRIAQKELAQRQQQAKERKAERIKAYNKEQQETDITHMSDIYEQTTRPTQKERQASYEQRKQQAEKQKNLQKEVSSFKQELDKEQLDDFNQIVQKMKNEQNVLHLEQEEQILRKQLNKNEQNEFDKLMQQMQEAQKEILAKEHKAEQEKEFEKQNINPGLIEHKEDYYQATPQEEDNGWKTWEGPEEPFEEPISQQQLQPTKQSKRKWTTPFDDEDDQDEWEKNSFNIETPIKDAPLTSPLQDTKQKDPIGQDTEVKEITSLKPKTLTWLQRAKRLFFTSHKVVQDAMQDPNKPLQTSEKFKLLNALKNPTRWKINGLLEELDQYPNSKKAQDIVDTLKNLLPQKNQTIIFDQVTKKYKLSLKAEPFLQKILTSKKDLSEQNIIDLKAALSQEQITPEYIQILAQQIQDPTSQRATSIIEALNDLLTKEKLPGNPRLRLIMPHKNYELKVLTDEEFKKYVTNTSQGKIKTAKEYLEERAQASNKRNQASSEPTPTQSRSDRMSEIAKKQGYSTTRTSPY